MSGMQSPRAVAQARLAAWLESHDQAWDAPYGVIEGMRDLPRGGKVRTVTFGVARTLDAIAWVWSADRIVIEGRGALAHAVEGEYVSVEAAVARLAAAVGVAA